MIYFELTDKEGRVVYTNLKDFSPLEIFLGREKENTPIIDGVKNIMT